MTKRVPRGANVEREDRVHDRRFEDTDRLVAVCHANTVFCRGGQKVAGDLRGKKEAKPGEFSNLSETRGRRAAKSGGRGKSKSKGNSNIH